MSKYDFCRTFRCGDCGHIFHATIETTFSEAKPGEFWHTAQGYVGKCPQCACYAHELTNLEEFHWILNTQDCHSPVLEKAMEGMKIAKEDKSNLFDNELQKAVSTLAERIRSEYCAYMGLIFKEENKEENTMKVSYKGFRGELIALKRYEVTYPMLTAGTLVYDLTIYDKEKQVECSFTGVSLKDVKFLGGEVSYG